MAGKMGWGVGDEQGWRKGPWTAEEDKLLNEYVSLHGEGRWSCVARSAGLKRSGKSCRLRWVNYLRPGLKRGHITPQEEGIIIELHAFWGNKWSTIARYLPGRTDNEIKNFWRTHFKKRDHKPIEKQEKRKFHGQKSQQEENPTAAPPVVSPQSEITNIDDDQQSLINTVRASSTSTYPYMENPICLPDAVTIDDAGLWGWLWNLEDQNGPVAEQSSHRRYFSAADWNWM